MKRYIQIACMLLSVAAFTACDDADRGLVVSQDTSYQLDPDYVYVDIPKEFQFDATNVLYLDGKTVLNLNAKTDGTTTGIKEGTEFKFNVRIKKALDKDLSVSLVQDVELLNEYNAGSAVLFPAETVALSDVVIPAGQTSATVTLNFQNLDQLTELAGYILPLRLQVAQATDDVKVSVQRYSVFVQMALEFGKDNVDTSSFQEFAYNEAFNDIIYMSSDYATVSKLQDGSLSSSTYLYEDDYIEMSLDKAEELLGFRIHIRSKGASYQLGHLAMQVDEGNGYINYGNFEFNEDKVVYFKFKQPTMVKSIKITGCKSVGNKNNGPDLYEIYFLR